MPMTREQLARTRPDHLPRLSPYGKARLTALKLMDGKTRLSDIEGKVWSRHQDIFATPADAAAFVSRLIVQET
jgi:hypothetical protein